MKLNKRTKRLTISILLSISALAGISTSAFFIYNHLNSEQRKNQVIENIENSKPLNKNDINLNSLTNIEDVLYQPRLEFIFNLIPAKEEFLKITKFLYLYNQQRNQLNNIYGMNSFNVYDYIAISGKYIYFCNILEAKKDNTNVIYHKSTVQPRIDDKDETESSMILNKNEKIIQWIGVDLVQDSFSNFLMYNGLCFEKYDESNKLILMRRTKRSLGLQSRTNVLKMMQVIFDRLWYWSDYKVPKSLFLLHNNIVYKQNILRSNSLSIAAVVSRNRNNYTNSIEFKKRIIDDTYDVHYNFFEANRSIALGYNQYISIFDEIIDKFKYHKYVDYNNNDISFGKSWLNIFIPSDFNTLLFDKNIVEDEETRNKIINTIELNWKESFENSQNINFVREDTENQIKISIKK